MTFARFINQDTNLKNDYEKIALTDARKDFSKITNYVATVRKPVILTRRNTSAVSLVPAHDLWLYDLMDELGIDKDAPSSEMMEVIKTVHEKSGDWLEKHD